MKTSCVTQLSQWTHNGKHLSGDGESAGDNGLLFYLQWFKQNYLHVEITEYYWSEIEANLLILKPKSVNVKCQLTSTMVRSRTML